MKKLIVSKRNIKIGPIGTALLGVLAVGTLVTALAILPSVAHIIAPFLKNKKYSAKQAITRNLESFIKSGLVEQIKNERGDLVLQLTKRGRWEALLRHQSLPSKDSQVKDWDKIWRMVIFDVPNERGRTRSELRRALHMYGFKPIQKSVWVYPHECDAFIALLKSHIGMKNNILYLKVSYIENDRHLRKEFRL